MLFRFLLRYFPRALAFGCLFSVILIGCKQKPTESEQVAIVQKTALEDRARIDSLENLIMKSAGKEDEKTLPQVLETLRSYQNYSIDYPRDTATPGYLLKSGEIYYNYLKDYENAEEYLNRLVDSFPKARQRPIALLLLGNAYHEQGDTAHAIDALHILEREFERTEYNRMAQEMIEYIRRTTPPNPVTGDQPPLGQEPKIN